MKNEWLSELPLAAVVIALIFGIGHCSIRLAEIEVEIAKARNTGHNCVDTTAD